MIDRACPNCGTDITRAVRAALRAQASEAGRARWAGMSDAERSAAARRNSLKYKSKARRMVAADKMWATRREGLEEITCACGNASTWLAPGSTWKCKNCRRRRTKLDAAEVKQ